MQDQSPLRRSRLQVPKSGIGTFETLPSVVSTSDHRRKADMAMAVAHRSSAQIALTLL